MSVVFKNHRTAFKASDVLSVNPELITAIVEQLLILQTEAFVDMIVENEKSENITRNSVNETLRGVKDSAHDFWNDVIFDIDRSVKARLKEAGYDTAVTGIKYDLAGDVTDVEVNVSVN